MLVEARVGGPGAPLPSRVGFAALPEPQHRRPSPPQARTSAPVPKNCPPVQVLLSIPRLSVRYGRERRHDHSGDAPPADRQRPLPLTPQPSSLCRCARKETLAGSPLEIGRGRRHRQAYGAPLADNETLLPPRKQVVPGRRAERVELARSGYNVGAGRVSCSPSGAAGTTWLEERRAPGNASPGQSQCGCCYLECDDQTAPGSSWASYRQ